MVDHPPVGQDLYGVSVSSCDSPPAGRSVAQSVEFVKFRALEELGGLWGNLENLVGQLGLR